MPPRGPCRARLAATLPRLTLPSTAVRASPSLARLAAALPRLASPNAAARALPSRAPRAHLAAAQPRLAERRQGEEGRGRIAGERGAEGGDPPGGV